MPVLMIISGLNRPQVSKFFKSFSHLYRDLPVRALDDKGNSRVGGFQGKMYWYGSESWVLLC